MAKGARLGIAAVTCGLLGACAGTTGTSSDDGECVSGYDHVARDPTWPRLKHEMLRYEELGRVASVRTQAQGDEVVSAGDRHVVRVVDLLKPNGRRLAQVDVWRTDSGAWHAGIWSQCID